MQRTEIREAFDICEEERHLLEFICVFKFAAGRVVEVSFRDLRNVR
jgi:hypothetical protein